MASLSSKGDIILEQPINFIIFNTGNYFRKLIEKGNLKNLINNGLVFIYSEHHQEWVDKSYEQDIVEIRSFFLETSAEICDISDAIVFAIPASRSVNKILNKCEVLIELLRYENFCFIDSISNRSFLGQFAVIDVECDTA